MMNLNNVNTKVAEKIESGEPIYVIVRKVDGEYWYYGADADEHKAWEVASEVGGMVEYGAYIHVLNTNPWA